MRKCEHIMCIFTALALRSLGCCDLIDLLHLLESDNVDCCKVSNAKRFRSWNETKAATWWQQALQAAVSVRQGPSVFNWRHLPLFVFLGNTEPSFKLPNGGGGVVKQPFGLIRLDCCFIGSAEKNKGAGCHGSCCLSPRLLPFARLHKRGRLFFQSDTIPLWVLKHAQFFSLFFSLFFITQKTAGRGQVVSFF